MVSSKAATPDDYIAELTPDRAALIAQARDLVNTNLPDGYIERMAWGMISWELPLDRVADTYNGQPLVFAALASQKNHAALYLNCIYASEERTRRLKDAYAAAGKKLDMGKSCIRFKRAQDLAEDVLAAEIATVSVPDFIAEYRASRSR